jgi:hypothetical protein
MNRGCDGNEISFEKETKSRFLNYLQEFSLKMKIRLPEIYKFTRTVHGFYQRGRTMGERGRPLEVFCQEFRPIFFIFFHYPLLQKTGSPISPCTRYFTLFGVAV